MPQPSSELQAVASLQQITAGPGWINAVRFLDTRLDWLDRVHVSLTEIPAPTFLESARAEYMAQKFRDLGLQRVRVDAAGNVLAERPGADANFVLLAAHLDTVFPAGTPVKVQTVNGRFCAPGISDNGAGLAALVGIAAALQESKVATGLSLLFAATVGEEGEGDLCGMRRIFSQKELCRITKAVLVIDGASIQRTATAGLGSRRFRVEVRGPGGHSWSDFGRVNPVHALADAVTQLSRLPLPSRPRTTMNVGLIHGGSAVNVIPDSAWMKLDVRSTEACELQRLTGSIETIMRAAVEAENQRGDGKLEYRIVPIGDRPAAQLPADARILQIIRDVDQYFSVETRFETSSTDGNIPLSLGIETITTGGGGTGGDAHTANEWYDPQGRELGLKRILVATLMLAGITRSSGER
ncbi:MAG: M20/M25/M40 family metallo-hydrolase [Acidobacteria bacterium]|nr:M20/M25/M40 family metallo-hydrolase [Acidobacteriota bacterium]